MEALLLSRQRVPISDLFLVDWSSPGGTVTFTDKSGRVTLNRNNANIAIIDDVALGRCSSGNGNGGWVQSNAQYPINLNLPKWTLSAEVIVANNSNYQVLMSQARSMSGSGGWYLSLSANSGRFDFYWQDAGNVWRAVSTTVAIPVGTKFTVRVTRNAGVLSIYIDDVLGGSTGSNITFNGAALALTIGQWVDTAANPWYGRIGKIRFTDS